MYIGVELLWKFLLRGEFEYEGLFDVVVVAGYELHPDYYI